MQVCVRVRLCAGFKALLRYEGFDGDSTRDFWLNLCAPDIHPVGWCAAGGKPLVPPQGKRYFLSTDLIADPGLAVWYLLSFKKNQNVTFSVSSAILHRFTNWKTFLINRLTGSKTLPPDFPSKVTHILHI